MHEIVSLFGKDTLQEMREGCQWQPAINKYSEFRCSAG